MIEIDNLEVHGFGAAYRGMRNSWKSHDKASPESDRALASRLIEAGPEHRKFLRFITVWFDINAPLYFLKQFDAYKVGLVQNSESTMHNLMRDGASLKDFSWDDSAMRPILTEVIQWMDLQRARAELASVDPAEMERNMIQILPSCFMQKRTICTNYETLRNMYQQRKNHKLSEWHEFCEMIEKLPESWMITDRR